MVPKKSIFGASGHFFWTPSYLSASIHYPPPPPPDANTRRGHRSRTRKPPSWLCWPRRVNSSTPNPDLWEVCVGRVVVNHLGSLTVPNPTQYRTTGSNSWESLCESNGCEPSRVSCGPELAEYIPATLPAGLVACARTRSKVVHEKHWGGCCLDATPVLTFTSWYW